MSESTDNVVVTSRLASGRLEGLGQAKIHHLDLVLARDHDVGGLHVAVQYARGVRCCEPSRNLYGVADRFRWPDRALCHQVAQGRAFHALHRDVKGAVLIRDVVDRNDIGMVQGGCGAGFADQPGDGGVSPDFAPRQCFQGDFTAQHEVGGRINLSHAASAELAVNTVLTNDHTGRDRHKLARVTYCTESSLLGLPAGDGLVS